MNIKIKWNKTRSIKELEKLGWTPGSVPVLKGNKLSFKPPTLEIKDKNTVVKVIKPTKFQMRIKKLLGK